MKIILLILFTCILISSFGQREIIGFRVDEDSIYMDIINIEDCTTRQLRSHVFPEFRTVSNNIHDLFHTFMYDEIENKIYYFEEDWIYVFDEKYKNAQDTFIIPVESINSIIDAYVKDTIMHLVYFTKVLKYSLNDFKFIDTFPLQYEGPNRFIPKATSTKFCTNYYIDFFMYGQIFFSKDLPFDFFGVERLLYIFNYIDFNLIFWNSKTDFIEYVQSCYFPDLLIHDWRYGIYRLNLYNNSLEKVCDLPYDYVNVYAIGEPEEADCLPLIDLHDDDCEWANQIDNQDTIACMSEKHRMVVDYPRVLSPLRVDSVLLTVTNIDMESVEIEAIEREGFSIRVEEDHWVIVNHGKNNQFLQAYLNGLFFSVPRSDASEISFSFTPYIRGEAGLTSLLDITILDYEESGGNHHYKVPIRKRFDLPLYTSTDDSYSWFPATYLDCTDCPTPTITPLSDIDYYVTITSPHGCQRIDTVSIQVYDSYPEVFIPNIINPRSAIPDNRFFGALGDDIASYDLEIAQRRGQLVYSASNLLPGKQVGWDGTFQGQLVPQGVYVYSITVYPEYADQAIYREVGTVTVVY